MNFLENHDLSQLSVQSIFEKMCQIQESRATNQKFKVKEYSPPAISKFKKFNKPWTSEWSAPETRNELIRVS